MKLPNGYGSVYKSSGKRRCPYRAIVTEGWQLDKDAGKWKQKRKTVGYYATKNDAMVALAEYNKSPFDLETSKITFAEIYNRWSDEHFPTISDSNIKGYKASYKLCEPITRKRFVDITLDDLQYLVDVSGKNTPTLRKLKSMLGLVFKYAVIHDIIPPDRNKVQYLDIKKAGNPNAYNRTRFSKQEISTLWNQKDGNIYINVVLMLIYSGVRISELLDLKKENVNIKERWFDVTASKTDAGIRKVPINKKVLPFFEHWYNKNDCEYLISTPEGEHFGYRNYYDSYWIPLMIQLKMGEFVIEKDKKEPVYKGHRPHDCRHTCVSLLVESGVDDRMVKKIVGHKGQGVTQQVYTHLDIDALVDAIDRI